jgi:glutathione S-transferase
LEELRKSEVAQDPLFFDGSNHRKIKRFPSFASFHLSLVWAAGKLLQIESERRSSSTPKQFFLSKEMAQKSISISNTFTSLTLWRDTHSWCPYSQKVWFFMMEKGLEFETRKEPMRCYGLKSKAFLNLVPSGFFPALQINDKVITESDRILLVLEKTFGPLHGIQMEQEESMHWRQMERDLFRGWCNWLCYPCSSEIQNEKCKSQFERILSIVDQRLVLFPYFMGKEISVIDCIFVPYLERMVASLFYYKGFVMRDPLRYPGICSWLSLLEQRPTYLKTRADFHTHCHDLPPQMGNCFSWPSSEQKACQRAVDEGPFINPSFLETTQIEPGNAREEAFAAMKRYLDTLIAVNIMKEKGDLKEAFVAALDILMGKKASKVPHGASQGLLFLRDRVNVPRDMSLHAARYLRDALTKASKMDPCLKDQKEGTWPLEHRRDQDPVPFQSIK